MWRTAADREGTSPNFPLDEADVLLIFAEALNEQNKTNEAFTYINEVRERAYTQRRLGPSTPVGNYKACRKHNYVKLSQGNGPLELAMKGTEIDLFRNG